MDEKKIIKIDENTVLVRKAIGFFTKCDRCGKKIGGGEEAYYPHVKSGNSVSVKKPICVECGEESVPK